MSRKVAIHKGFVDDRRRGLRSPVGAVKESAFAKARTDGQKVIAADDPRERDLFAGLIVGLARENIESRLVVYRQWNSRNRAGLDDAGNRTNSFQLRVDEGDALVEVAIAEQRRDKRQQLLAANAQIELPQMLKRLQQQPAARQQHDRERRLDDDERMLEPVAAR